MAVVWDKATFDQLYRTKPWHAGIRRNSAEARLPPFFHYNWFGVQNGMTRQLDRFLSVPGAAQISDLCVIGGAWGWFAEMLESRGINTINVDTSTYVLDNQNVSEEGEIRDILTAGGMDWDNLPDCFVDPNDFSQTVDPRPYWLHPSGGRSGKPVIDEDMSTNTSRKNVRQALGNNMDAILTEFVLDGFDVEADALSFVERCEQLRPNPNCNVLHFVLTVNDHPLFLPSTQAEWRQRLDANGFTNHWVINQLGQVVT